MSSLRPIGEGEPFIMQEDEPFIMQDEGPALSLINDRNDADVILICEHASNRIPRSLDNLGLDEEACLSHVAWDPGAGAVAREMSTILEAPLILQNFSRLVYDCNRPPEAESAMPVRSEIFDIPGNRRLSDRDKALRTEAIYHPFHAKVTEVIDRSLQAGVVPAIVTLHSFTPIFHGKPRAVEIGLLHDADSRLVEAMLVNASKQDAFDLKRNQPYGPEDGVTHTLKRHAIARGLLNVMIEIRNDLIKTADQQSSMARRMAVMVREALDGLRRAADQRHERVRRIS